MMGKKVGKRLRKGGKRWEAKIPLINFFSVFAEAAIFNLSISRGLGC
jgi:hypothetical protein